MHGRAHPERTFRTYGANGVAEDYKMWQDAWVLVDGGYQHVQVSYNRILSSFLPYLYFFS
jgi:hypothetical protein